MKYPTTVTIIELEVACFRNSKDADRWAREHGVIGMMSNIDSKGKGEIAISARSINKMLSGSALRKSVTPEIHYAAIMRLRDIIRESFIAEIHPDYRKGLEGIRSEAFGINEGIEIAVLYGCVSMAGIPFRAKTTLKLHADINHPTKAYSYEISNIEVLAGTVESEIRPNTITSMIDTNILLQGVRDVNGELLIK